MKKVNVFFRGQLLELFLLVTLLCVDHPDDGATYNSPEIRQKFVQAALISSDIWSKRIFRKRALGSIRKSVEANVAPPELETYIGRGWVLFREYFPKYYQYFDNEFFLATKINLEEYFIIIALISVEFLTKKLDDQIFDINNLIEHETFGHTFSKYFEIESINPDDFKQKLLDKENSLIESNDKYPIVCYRMLREKSIMRANDGRCIIIDSVFSSEKSSVGPLFHILNHQNCRHNDVFIAFGHAFEEYTLDILWRMFSSPERLASRFSKR